MIKIITKFNNRSKYKTILKNRINFSFSNNIIIYLINKIFVDNNNFKVCLCTLAKNENNYIKEYVRYYKNYGVDKIFIYDNNDINGERFENILNKYIENKFVEIIDYRGKYKIQLEILNHCYKNNYKKYNWFILFDIDEFIFLKNLSNIKKFLHKNIFVDCKVIFLNEKLHSDNNHIYYKKGMVTKRFKQTLKNSIAMVKPILRGNIENLTITNNHVIKINMKGCNGFGQKIIINRIFMKNPDYNNYYFDHYYFKSSEEYLNKLEKGSCYWGNKRKIDLSWLKKYFKSNKIILEKINFFEMKTSINLSIYKKNFNIK